MNKAQVCAALVALGLTAPTLGRLPSAQTRAAGYNVGETQDPATDAPSDAVSLAGVVTHVDGDRDRVSVTADDGHHYTLDTSRTDIILPGMDRSGDTGDLTQGMRLRVDGARLGGDTIQADRIRVVGSTDAPPPAARPEVRPSEGDGIDLRGTVQSVNQRRGSFVVHITDHTRTVIVTDQTELTPVDEDKDLPDRVPLRPGERVTVSGTLRADGTVTADTIRASHADPAPEDRANTRELVGKIVEPSDGPGARDPSDGPGARDITMEDSAGRQVSVHVPAGTPVTRDGSDIRLRDLTRDDTVRVSGAWDGDDFRADSLTVVPRDDNKD